MDTPGLAGCPVPPGAVYHPPSANFPRFFAATADTSGVFNGLPSSSLHGVHCSARRMAFDRSCSCQSCTRPLPSVGLDHGTFGRHALHAPGRHLRPLHPPCHDDWVLRPFVIGPLVPALILGWWIHTSAMGLRLDGYRPSSSHALCFSTSPRDARRK